MSFWEHDNEPLGPTEGRDFLHLASSYQLYMGKIKKKKRRKFKYRHDRLEYFLLQDHTGFNNSVGNPVLQNIIFDTRRDAWQLVDFLCYISKWF